EQTDQPGPTKCIGTRGDSSDEGYGRRRRGVDGELVYEPKLVNLGVALIRNRPISRREFDQRRRNRARLAIGCLQAVPGNILDSFERSRRTERLRHGS